MGWLADTFPAVFGHREATGLARAVGDVPGQVFGDPDAKTAAAGIIQGMFPWGTPPKRGTRELILLYSASPWLRAAVGRIATSVAQTHWRLYKIKDTGTGRAIRMKGLQKAPPIVRARMLRDIRSGRVKAPSGARLDIEIVDDHPMLDFLEAGNAILNGHDSQMVAEIHHELAGDSFSLLERWESGSLKGKPKAYWPIPPYWVQMTPTTESPFYRLQWQGWNAVVPETEIVWDRDPDPFFPYGRGIGAAQSIADELQSDENASKFINAWFYNRALPAAVVSLENASPTEAKRIGEDWRQKFAGVMKAFQVHFTSSKVSVAQLQNTFEQMQLIDLRKFERDTILQTLGYPGEILGIIENANRSTIDTAAYRLEKYCIEPKRERRRRLYQGRLCREWDERIFIDYEPEVPEDKEFLLLAAKARPYAFTNNGFLEAMGLPQTDETWGEERPPTPVAAPPQAETIPTKGADPEWVKQLGGRVRLLEAAAEDSPRRLLPAAPVKAGSEEDEDFDAGPGGGDDGGSGGGGSDFNPDSIEDVIAALEQSGELDAMAERMADCIKDFGEATRAQVAESYDGDHEIPDAFSMKNPRVTSYLADFSSEDVTNIQDTTKAYLRDFLAKAYEHGDSIDDMVKALGEDTNFAFGEARAERIARTEILSASNFATLEGAKQTGVVDQKIWVATPGTMGSRESHEELDGDTIGIDEEWTDSETGATAQHPGGFGDPASDCNCRCAASPWVSDPGDGDKAMHGARIKLAVPAHADIEKRRAPHEAALQRAAAKGLATQRAAVIKAIRKARR